MYVYVQVAKPSTVVVLGIIMGAQEALTVNVAKNMYDKGRYLTLTT